MKNNVNKVSLIISTVILVIIFAAFAVLNKTGGIQYTFGDSALSVHTAVWKDISVTYADVDSVSLETGLDTGRRTNGYGSRKLSIGTFKNDTFGSYTLYSFTGCDPLAVLHMKDDSVIVLSGKNKTATEEIYSGLTEKLSVIQQQKTAS